MTLSASTQAAFPIYTIFRLNVNIYFSSRLNTNFSQSQNLYSKSKYYLISSKMTVFLTVTWSDRWGLRLYRGIIGIFYDSAFFTNKIILTYSKCSFEFKNLSLWLKFYPLVFLYYIINIIIIILRPGYTKFQFLRQYNQSSYLLLILLDITIISLFLIFHINFYLGWCISDNLS